MHRWASLARVRDFVPVARALGVSERARARGQFVEQYAKAGGDWRRLPAAWRDKREAFVERHLAQAKKRREVLYSAENRCYSRRGLALLMWAYDPRIRT